MKVKVLYFNLSHYVCQLLDDDNLPIGIINVDFNNYQLFGHTELINKIIEIYEYDTHDIIAKKGKIIE